MQKNSSTHTAQSVRMETLILSRKDLAHLSAKVGLEALLDDLIGRLEGAIRDYDAQRTVIPMRDGFNYAVPSTGLIEWMPLMQQGRRVLVKTVGYHPHNPEQHGLPTILSTVATYDVRHGHLIALADATFLTALRTGAASAVASRIMARPDSATLGLIGCGAQAVTQAHALSRLFAFKRLLVYDIDRPTMDSLPARLSGLGMDHIPIEAVSPEEAARRSDILCVSTSVEVGMGPVFHDVETRPWLHINAVGSDFPGKIELPKPLLLRSFVCPDFPEQARREGECQQLPAEAIGPSLADVLQQPARFRDLPERLTVFDSTGWALEDQVAFDLLLEHAERVGVGSRIEIESLSEDPKDPYGFLGTKSATRRSPTLIELLAG